MITLYSYFRSSAAYRVRLALNYKNIRYDQIHISLVDGEQRSNFYLAKNPQGLVPALALQDKSVITQSTAILEWLEETYPKPSLYPSDGLQKAKVRSVANTIACDIHPLNNLRVLKYLKEKFNVAEEEKLAWYHHWLKEAFDALEGQLAPEAEASADNVVSMIDVYLIPQVYNALRFKFDMDFYPNILKIYTERNKLDAFVRASPENTEAAMIAK